MHSCGGWVPSEVGVGGVRYLAFAVSIMEAEASRPRTECAREAISAVRRPSPQPRSRILSVGCGSSHWVIVVASWGTKAAEVV